MGIYKCEGENVFHFDRYGLSKDENHNTVPWSEWPPDAANEEKYNQARAQCPTCRRYQ